METSQTSAEVLSEQPWLPVCISDCQLLTKAWFGDTTYHILLTDITHVWEERMDSSAIQNRAQALNKRLRAPVEAFFSHLQAAALPCLSGEARVEAHAHVSLVRQGTGGITVRLKSELAGLPFRWEFHCTPPTVALVCSQLVRPLLSMSRLLQRQVEQLGALLARKDWEIQDYKENGATLSRARLQTEAFDEQTYKCDFVAQAVPQVCSGQQEGFGFDADLRELYVAVVSHGGAGQRKRKLPEGPDAQDAPAGAEGREAERAPSRRAPPRGEGPVGCDAAAEAGQSASLRKDAAADKKADGPEEQQPLAVAPAAAERLAPKPKKKKPVGLFR